MTLMSSVDGPGLPSPIKRMRCGTNEISSSK